MRLEDLSCSHAAIGAVQNMPTVFDGRRCSPNPPGAAELALELWRLVEHLPAQLAAEALAAAIVLRQQEVAWRKLSHMVDMLDFPQA